MRRLLLLSLLSLFVLVAALLATGRYLLRDEDFLKARLHALVLQQTGRELAIDGPLRLDLGSESTLEARGIRLQNAAWAEGDMLAVGHLRLTVNLRSLFAGTPVIPSLLLEDCELRFEKSADGAGNWPLRPASADPTEDAAEPGLPVLLQDGQVRNCRLRFASPQREIPLQLTVDRFAVQLPDDGSLRAEGAGRVNEEALSLSGRLAPLSALAHGGPLRYDVQATAGDIELRSSGAFQDVRSGRGADLEMRFDGPEVARLLHYFGLPDLSQGAFDFRLDLDAQGPLTRLALDGDLGSLEARAEGELDRLFRPTQGRLSGTITGPDLDALGRTLGVAGLTAQAYELNADADFEPGFVRVRTLSLDSAGDHMAANGVLGTGAALAGSDLEFSLAMQQAARLGAVFGRQLQAPRPLALSGRLQVDTDGRATLRAQADYAASVLAVEGSLGRLSDPLKPDVHFDFHAANLRPLASLFGGPHDSLDLPAVPAAASGRVSKPDALLRLDAVEVELAGHRARIDGRLGPRGRLAGSELALRLDSPDAAELVGLFGHKGVLHEPVTIDLALEPAGQGLAFRSSSRGGGIRLAMDGRIADLAQLHAIDARFDIDLPSLTLLSLLFPATALPDLPLTARGQLETTRDGTRLEDVELSSGTLRATLGGRLLPGQRFDLSLRIEGPDAGELQPLAGIALPAESFGLQARLAGTPSAFDLTGLTAQLGRSRATGDLQIALVGARRVAGRIRFPLLDLGWWNSDAPERSTATRAPGDKVPAYVFDDRPITRITDHGVSLELDLGAALLDLGNTQLHELAVVARMSGQRLELEPFSLQGAAGGKYAGRFVLDGAGAQPTVDLQVDGQGVRLGLAAVADQDPATIPETELHVDLHGTGATAREMASGLNGALRLYAGPGLVPAAGLELLFNDFLTELFNLLNPFAEKSPYTRVECSVAAADIVNGLVTVSPLLLNSEEITIFSQGTIDLRTEKVDLSFNTKPRTGLGLSPGVLINPFIKVGGRLAEPAIELDPKSAVVSGSAAVATVGLSLLAKSLSDRFLSSKDPCGDARKEIEKRDE